MCALIKQGWLKH